MARPIPVLPDVGSTIVPPGFSAPDLSASSIIESAIRSLIEPPGLARSDFTQTSASPNSRLIRMCGVPPMVSRILAARMFFLPIRGDGSFRDEPRRVQAIFRAFVCTKGALPARKGRRMAPTCLEIEDALTAAQCDSIIGLAQGGPMHPAPVYNAGDHVIDPRTRDVLLC